MSTEFFNDQWRIPSNENQNKISNYSMEFDGSSTKIDLGSTIGNIGVSSTTISFWLNIPTSTSHQTVLSNRGSGAGWAIDMFDNAGQYTISFFNASSSTSIRCGFSDFNTWAHIVIVRDGIANNKIYINGVSQTLTNNNENLTNIISSKTLTIGAQDPLSTGYYRFLNGKIDQLTFFDYALSQDQVTQLGAEGYAFNFIPNDRINVGNDSSLNITGDLTLSIWMKTTSTAIQGLISKAGSATTRSFGLYIYYSNNVSVVQSYVATDGTTYGFTGGGLPAASGVHDGNWHHILMVNDPTTTNNYLYVDGVEVKTTTNGRSIFSSTVDTNIGFLDPSYRFNGELSNAQIFNSVIPPTGSNSVQTLYNNGKPLSDMSGFTSLQGWWKLDDTATFNSGTSVWSIPDASTNSNTGASVGLSLIHI